MYLWVEARPVFRDHNVYTSVSLSSVMDGIGTPATPLSVAATLAVDGAALRAMLMGPEPPLPPVIPVSKFSGSSELPWVSSRCRGDECMGELDSLL